MNYELTKVDIVGLGKVGKILLDFFCGLDGVSAQGVSSRTLEGVRDDADFIFLTVSDDAIQEVARRLGRPSAILLHVSGTKPLTAISEFADRTGVFYPFQSFSPGVEVDLQNVSYLINSADSSVTEQMKDLLSRMGAKRYYECTDEQRKLLHLAGVFAGNFTNEMIAIGQQILTAGDLPTSLLEALVRQTVEKALCKGASAVRTGPASRGDMQTISAQQALIAERFSEIGKIYESITQHIINSR